eukprot:TRINITY_DN29894_c0_g1_i1.p1 TRINITY_DN29894_c0_g1~~TRINITY_DN29894_c0_g1_i1.p1  ORF type:complete len:140 (-),score=31.57 TRINITY_DN29894_c0_g1_i1:82-501(-)
MCIRDSINAEYGMTGNEISFVDSSCSSATNTVTLSLMYVTAALSFSTGGMFTMASNVIHTKTVDFAGSLVVTGMFSTSSLSFLAASTLSVYDNAILSAPESIGGATSTAALIMTGLASTSTSATSITCLLYTSPSPRDS